MWDRLLMRISEHPKKKELKRHLNLCLRIFISFQLPYILVLVNFVVDDGDNTKYILKSLSKKWRDARCRVFGKYYNWELGLEDNIRNCPPNVDEDHWVVFLHYRLSAKTVEIANKNASNREKLVIPHTLGSKTLARKRNELEKFQEKFQNEIQGSSSENKAFASIFGKKHPGYVRGMGLGVTPSQVIGSTSMRSDSFSNAKIEKMQTEIDTLKAQVAQVDILKEQIAFILQNAKGNQPDDLESPRDGRRLSASSHNPVNHRTSSRDTI